MKRIIVYFLIILGSIWLGIKIYQNPGYILVMYQQWAIETTTWFVVLIMLLLFLILHVLINLLKNTAHLPDRIEHWWQRKRLRKSIKLLNQGFCELITGKYKKAEKHLLKSAKKPELAFIDYVKAAQAANAQHESVKRDKYLLKAQALDPRHDHVIDILRVDFYLDNHQAEEALALLLKLHQEKPKDGHVLQLLTETYLMSSDYLNLQKILPDIKKAKVFDDAFFAEIEQETYLHAFKDQFFADFSEVQLLWNKMPKYLRHKPDILIAYAAHLNRWNRGSEAEELIRKELKKQYDRDLMKYYAKSKSQHPVKQVALVEKWFKDHSDDPDTLMIMGQLCIRNRLWGQARDYLESSLRLHATPEVYSILGYVYERLGESEKAFRYYRRGLKYII